MSGAMTKHVWLAALFVLAFSGAIERRAWADDDRASEARTHFRKGVALYDDGEFASALAEFRRAQDLAPDYRLLYNIGQTSVELGDFAAAHDAFEAYLRDGGPRIAPDRRDEVTSELAKLELKIARVTIDVPRAGGIVHLDGRSIGRAPLGRPAIVNAGRHELRLEEDGRFGPLVAVQLGVGESARVTLRVAESHEERVKPSSNPRATWGTVSLATGGVLVVGAAVSALTLVPSTIESFDDARMRGDPSAADEQSRARLYQRLTIGAAAAGIVLAATGGVLLLLPRESPRAPAGVHSRFTLAAGAGAQCR